MCSSKTAISVYILSIILVIASSLIAENDISGIVFLDENKNNKLDDAEEGIAGVIVSNQREVVITDDNGNFTLPLIEGRTIFVTKPAGYTFSLDKYNIPQFSFTYSPKGSPSGLKFKGLDPTNEMPDKLYFPLYEDEYSESFNAIVVGDPQADDSVEVNYYRDDIVEEMIGKDASFYIALGDIAGDNLDIYEHYNDVVSQLGIPAFNVPGNHDENYRVKDDTHAMDTFKRIYGPEYYSFNYGKVHFVVLDIVEYAGWDSTENKHGTYRGYLHKNQLTWLKNDLNYVPDDHLVALTMHIPIVTEHSTSENVNLVNRNELFKILESRNHILALSGHMHIIENLKLNQNNGWNSATPFYSFNVGAGCGAWWSGPKDERNIPVSFCMDGSPNGYYIFSFKGNQFNQNFYPANQSADYQIRISCPSKSVKKDSLAYTQIIANVFNADSETEVYCQIDNSDRMLMMQKRMKDPFAVDYLKNNRDDFPWWITDVSNTSHIWIAELLPGLETGQHTIKISAIDGKNNIYSQTKIFEVIK